MRIAPRLARPAAVAALAAAALALPAASAERRAARPLRHRQGGFHAQMKEARFWIGAADRLAGAGFEWSAQQATDFANNHLGQAEAAQNAMSAAC